MTSTENLPLTEGEAVLYAGQRYEISWINYNAGSHTCRTYCRRMDLRNTAGTRLGIRECELTAAPAVPAEGTVLHTWDLDRLTIAVTYVGGVYDSYQVTVCYLGTVNTVGDLRWAVRGVDRAVTVCLTLVAKLRSTSPQRAIDVCPNLSDLHDLAA